MFFEDCTDLPSVKKRYRELSRLLHPDKGGDEDYFIRLKEEYELRSKASFNFTTPNNPDCIQCDAYRRAGRKTVEEIKKKDRVINELNQELYLKKYDLNILRSMKWIERLKFLFTKKISGIDI